MRRVEELLELPIGHGILVDKERRNLHLMLMEPPRRVLPRVLHIDPRVSPAFNLSPGHLEDELPARNAHHTLRSLGHRNGSRYLDDPLRQDLRRMRVAGQRLAGHCGHALHQRFNRLARLPVRLQNRPVSVRLKTKAQHGKWAAGIRIGLGFQLRSVVQIEVPHPGRSGHIHLSAVNFVSGPVHDGPYGIRAQRPAAGKHSKAMHGIERLPVSADEEWRHRPLNGCNAPRGLSVAGSDPYPETPHVLPALPANAVEEGELQVVGLVAVPAVADVRHVPRLQPLVTVHHGDERKAVLAPGHDVPGQGFIAGVRFRLKRQRMPNLLRTQREAQRHAVLCVAVHAVRVNLLHQRRNRVGPRLVGLVRALVPHHHREEHADASTVKVGDHLADALDTPRHRRNHFKLIPVVDPHVGVGSPNQHRIDPAIAFFQVVEIAIDGIAPSGWVVEIAILNHHLRLDEAGLGPFQGRELVARGVVGDADTAFRAPVLDVAEPALMRKGQAARRQHIFPGVMQVQTIGRGDLLAARTVLSVLRGGGEHNGHCESYKEGCAEHAGGFLHSWMIRLHGP